MIIDGAEVKIFERGGRHTVARALCEPGTEFDLARLASLAAGRFLREEAVLSWDHENGVPILWQDIAATASQEEKTNLLNRFLASVDWWVERLNEEPQPAPVLPEMMILP